MALSTLIQVAAGLAALTFNFQISKSQDARLAEELKCLQVKPADQCNLAVTYADPLKTVKCGILVPESKAQSLSQPPTLKVVPPVQTISNGLLIMFDPDAPMSSQPEDGFIHWIAFVSVDNNGDVQIERVNTDYYKPSPPKGNGPHRYQFFLFEYSSYRPLVVGNGRKFHLCTFFTDNNLSQPIAASEFKFERI